MDGDHVQAVSGDSRSGMARASDALPFRPYFPGGRRVRALTAERNAPPAPAPPPPDEPPTRCDDCGYLLTAPGHKVACGE